MRQSITFILLWNDPLHVLDDLSFHDQEFKIVHTATGICQTNTGLSKKMDGIWNRYNLKSTGRVYTFCVLKCSEKFKVLDLP